MTERGPGPAPILFTHYGEEWIRGSERCLLDLLTHLDRNRFRPILWCNAEMLAAEVRKLDIPVEVTPFTILFHWVPPRFAFRRYLSQVRKGRELVRRHGIRLLHSNSAAPTQWLFPVARSARIPLVTHIHARYFEWDRFTLGLHQTTLAVGVTHGCIEGLIADGFPGSRTTTIYNGVDLSTWQGHDLRGLRGELGIGAEEIVITQVGSLIRRKGHDLLFRAFADLKRLRPERGLRLVIVGDGPDRPAIEALARELGIAGSVHFLGFIAPPPGVVFRDVSDIGVSPSRGEGFGLTVIEAGAAGRPVVATDTTGMREILTDGESGLIVPVEDSASLGRALLRLVDDAELRRRLGGRLHAVVQERFLIERYVEGLEEAYTRLLARPREELGWIRSGWRGEPGMYFRWTASAAARRLTRWRRRGEAAVSP